MSDQLEPPQQPFQERPVYNQPSLPNQQQHQTQRSWPQAGYPQQTGTGFGNQQQPYPQQSQWGQPPTPQYGYPQQTQYAGQFVQNNVLTPPPPPQFQQEAPKPSGKGFFKKRVSVPIWAILLSIVLLISIFATSVYAIGNKSKLTNTSITTSSSSTVGPETSIPTSIPTSAPIPTDIPTFAPTSVPTPVGPSKIAGTIIVSDIACTYISVQTLQSDGFVLPKPGNTFIVVHVKLINESSSSFSYSEFDFQAISGSGNGTNIEVPPSTYTANDELNIGTLIPGGTVQGDLIFEIPIGDHKAELSWQPSSLGSPTDNVWNLGL